MCRARPDQIINLKPELAQLAGQIDWDFIDGEAAPVSSDKGRPGSPTLFAIGLLLLKQIYWLSDECACERWVYHPYSSTPGRSSSSTSSRTRPEPLA
jgi:IS5 family transposase